MDSNRRPPNVSNLSKIGGIIELAGTEERSTYVGESWPSTETNSNDVGEAA